MLLVNYIFLHFLAYLQLHYKDHLVKIFIFSILLKLLQTH